MGKRVSDGGVRSLASGHRKQGRDLSAVCMDELLVLRALAREVRLAEDASGGAMLHDWGEVGDALEAWEAGND